MGHLSMKVKTSCCERGSTEFGRVADNERVRQNLAMTLGAEAFW